MDVAAWLKNLGLGQYEAAFRDNAIDGDLLPSLTAEDLRDSGRHDRRPPAKTPGRDRCARRGVQAGGPSRRGPDGHFVRARRVFPTSAGIGSRRGAPPDHGDVLRSRRLDEPRGEARRGGLAQPRQRLSRRGLRRRDGAWRPCAEKTRRRADGPLRLSARRRRTTPSARCAPRSLSSARSPILTPATREPARPSSPRASASTPAPSWSTRPARCSARRRTSPRASRPSPNREPFS